jgi:hypothetical protein
MLTSSAVSEISPELIAKERELLARLLASAAVVASSGNPRPRKLRGIRKVSETVERTAVSAGCFGEAIQWRLKAR